MPRPAGQPRRARRPRASLVAPEQRVPRSCVARNLTPSKTRWRIREPRDEAPSTLGHRTLAGLGSTLAVGFDDQPLAEVSAGIAVEALLPIAGNDIHPCKLAA